MKHSGPGRFKTKVHRRRTDTGRKKWPLETTESWEQLGSNHSGGKNKKNNYFWITGYMDLIRRNSIRSHRTRCRADSSSGTSPYSLESRMTQCRQEECSRWIAAFSIFVAFICWAVTREEPESAHGHLAWTWTPYQNTVTCTKWHGSNASRQLTLVWVHTWLTLAQLASRAS